MTERSQSGDMRERLLHENLPHIHDLHALGYEPVEVLRNNERYIAYKLVKEGRTFFFKAVQGVEPEKIQNEIWFARKLRTADDSSVQSPNLYEYGSTWYIVDFFDTEPLCIEATCFTADLSKVQDALVKITSEIDKLPVGPEKPQEGLRESILKGAEKHGRLALEKGLISHDDMRRALEQINTGLEGMEVRVQHGDFTPWHIFDLGDQTYGLVDAEHAGVKPRFSDLATLYVRLFNRCNAPEVARKVLKGFIESLHISEDKFWKAFLPLLTQKALMGCSDSLIDWVQHNYKVASVQLLRDCLDKDIDALVGK